MENKKKDILVLGQGSTRLDDLTIAAEAKYSITFTESRKRFVLSLHNNGRKKFLFVNTTKLYQFKAKDSEIKPCLLCLRNNSKYFSVINLIKAGLNGYLYNFLVDYNISNVDDISNIHKYLMKKYDIK